MFSRAHSWALADAALFGGDEGSLTPAGRELVRVFGPRL